MVFTRSIHRIHLIVYGDQMATILGDLIRRAVTIPAESTTLSETAAFGLCWKR
jgi:hypothetical protein